MSTKSSESLEDDGVANNESKTASGDESGRMDENPNDTGEEKAMREKCINLLSGLTNKANPTIQDARKVLDELKEMVRNNTYTLQTKESNIKSIST